MKVSIIKLLGIAMLLTGLTACDLNSTLSETVQNPIIYEKLNSSKIQLNDEQRFNISLDWLADISEYKSFEGSISVNTYPQVCISDGITYVIERYPDNLTTLDEYIQYPLFSDPEKVLKIYNDYDYNEPDKTVFLKGLSGFICYAMAKNEDETISLLGTQRRSNEEPIEIWYYLYNLQGEMLDKSELADVNTMDIADAVISDGNVYYQSAEDELTVWDTQKGLKTVLAEGIWSFCFSGDELYYVKEEISDQYEVEINIYTVNPHDMESRRIDSLKTVYPELIGYSETISSMAYDAEKSVLYFTTILANSPVYAYQISEKKLVKVADSSEKHLRIYAIQNDVLILHNGIQQLRIYELPDTPTDIRTDIHYISVCDMAADGGQMRAILASAVQAMERDGIYVELVDAYHSGHSVEYNNTMAKKLMAGDQNFDLVYLNEYTPELYRETYYADLLEYSVMAYYYGQLLPGLSDICSVNGSVMLVPLGLGTELLSIRKDVIDHVGSVPSDFHAIPGFLEEASSVSGLTDESMMSSVEKALLIDPWMDQFITNFMLRSVDDRTAYRDLEMLLETAVQILSHPQVKIGKHMGDNLSSISVVSMNGYAKADTAQAYFTLPKLNEEYRYCFSGAFLAVNENSPNRDVASLLLAYMMECDKAGSNPNSLLYINEYQSESYELFRKQAAEGARKISLIDTPVFIHGIFEEITSNRISVKEGTDSIWKHLCMIRDE